MLQYTEMNSESKNSIPLKLRIAVIYGGRSSEHEISLRSAASVIKNLDRNRYEVLPIAIDKSGHWHLNSFSKIEIFLETKSEEALPLFTSDLNLTPEVILPGVNLRGSDGELIVSKTKDFTAIESKKIDVVFPVLHGPMCEDGTIQGLLELTGLPYVGSGVLGSAMGMDKDIAKRLVGLAGVPVVPSLLLRKDEWLVINNEERSKILQSIQYEFKYPIFVKPCNLGSSVGVSKVEKEEGLFQALEIAFQYDLKVIVEKAVSAREIEISVLENLESRKDPVVSVPGEVIPHHDFYSYEAKYLDENGASFKIPAELNPHQIQKVQELARRAFIALECEAMARIDFLFEQSSNIFYFNELNTIPGFTSISMYPKLLAASGISYTQLLTRLIDLAIARNHKKNALVRDWKQKLGPVQK